jgi:hypothetical protein
MEEGMLSGLYRTFPTLQHLWIEHDRLLTSTARKQMYENYDYTFDKFEKFILLDADTYDPNKALHIHYEISRCNNDILLSNSIIQNDKSNDINFDYKKAEIIIDTGATDSMFPWCIIFCKIYLYNKNTINELWRRVSFGDQKQGLTISGYGTVNLINTALYVPGLDQGVIGVGSLDKRGAYTGIFNGKLVVYDRTGDVILTATNRNNLYYLDDVYKDILFDTERQHPYDLYEDTMDGKSDISLEITVNDNIDDEEYSIDDSANSSNNSLSKDKIRKRNRKRLYKQRKMRATTTDDDIDINQFDAMNYLDIINRVAKRAYKIAGCRRVPRDKISKVKRFRRKKSKYYSTWKEREDSEDTAIFKAFFTKLYHSGKSGNSRIKFGNSEENILTKIHKKWGHLSENRIKLAYKKGLVVDNDYNYDDIKHLHLPTCTDCMEGRMKRFTSEPTTHHNWQLYDKVACDYKGPFKHKSYQGYTGFYLFSDYYSDEVYAYPVKNKNELTNAVQSYWRERILKKKKIDNNSIIVFQSDDEMVAKSKSLLSWMNKNNIIPQRSIAYKHSQNGQIERDMGNVLDRARTLLSSYHVPYRFWWHAIRHAT